MLLRLNQRHWLKERGQWLENVDLTHLVLASGNQYYKSTTKTDLLTPNRLNLSPLGSHGVRDLVRKHGLPLLVLDFPLGLLLRPLHELQKQIFIIQ